MKKFCFWLFSAFLWLGSAVAFPAETGKIAFVSSVKELEEAFNLGSGFAGLAVRSEFYNSSDAVLKGKINELAGRTLAMNLRPVFVYGKDIDIESTKQLFGGLGNFSCKPLAMAGIFFTILLNTDNLTGATIEMCGSLEEPASEEWLRDWVSNYWSEIKIALKNEGYATLP